jgi:hypothetical protein
LITLDKRLPRAVDCEGTLIPELRLEGAPELSFVGCDKLAKHNACAAWDFVASAGTPGTGLEALASIQTAFWCAGARRNAIQQGNAAPASLSHPPIDVP